MTEAPSYRALVQHRGFLNVLIAASLCRLAGRMVTLATILFTLSRFHAPSAIGWVAFASLAPGLVLSPLTGVLLHRIGPLRGIAADMLASAVLLLALVAVSVGQQVTEPFLLIIVALFSLTTPLSAAAIRVLIPALVPACSLDRANSLDAATYAIVDVVGPALAGVLFAFVGPHGCFTIIALLYLIAAAALIPVGRVTLEDSGAPGLSLITDAVAGIRYLWRNQTLRGLALSYSLYQVSIGVLIVIVPVLLNRLLEEEAIAAISSGGLFAAAGLAGACGALMTGRLNTENRERRLIAFGSLVTAIAIFPGAAFFGAAGLVISVMIVGFCAGPVDVGLLSLRQRRTHPGWLARVLAVSMSLNLAGLPIGSAIGGILIMHSASLALAVGALGALLAALIALTLEPASS